MRPVRRTWSFDVLRGGETIAHTTYWGPEAAAKRRLVELQRQMERLKPGATCRMGVLERKGGAHS